MNAAVARGRPDLARELADEYAADAAYLVGQPLVPGRRQGADARPGWLRRVLTRSRQ